MKSVWDEDSKKAVNTHSLLFKKGALNVGPKAFNAWYRRYLREGNLRHHQLVQAVRALSEQELCKSFTRLKIDENCPHCHYHCDQRPFCRYCAPQTIPSKCSTIILLSPLLYLLTTTSFILQRIFLKWIMANCFVIIVIVAWIQRSVPTTWSKQRQK